MGSKEISYQGKRVFIGIDVHRGKYAVFSVVSGVHVDNFVYHGSESGLVSVLSKRYINAKSIRCCYEAGFSGYGLCRKLKSTSIDCVVVHPGAVAVSSAKKKTDKRDAKQMSYQLFSGSLRGIYVPSESEEDLRRFCRLRRNLVKDRTRMRTRVRMLYHYYGILPLDFTGVLSYLNSQRIYVSQIRKLGDGFTKEIGTYLDSWKFLSDKIRNLDVEIKQSSVSSEIDKYYLSVPGIGMLTARVLATELGDMSRFGSAKRLYSYLGLTPGEFSSGENRRLGHISREGKPILRAMLIQAAWRAIKVDDALAIFYSRLKTKKGGKRAIVAVARKLAGIARSCIREKRFYEMPKLEQSKLAA